jgi:hypothetical protein
VNPQVGSPWDQGARQATTKVIAINKKNLVDVTRFGKGLEEF